MPNLDRINYSVKIAVIIRALRNALSLSQNELADAAGCSRPTVNRIEVMDKASPRGNTIDNIFHVFREMGAEIQIGDDEIHIKFTRNMLICAEGRLTKKEKKRDTNRVGAEKCQETVDNSNGRTKWMRLFSIGGANS